MRPLENRARPHGEVQLAGVAAVVSALAGRDALAVLALRAFDAVRPQTAFEIGASARLIGEGLEQLERANR